MSDRPLPHDVEVSHHRKRYANRKRLSDGIGSVNTNQPGLRVAIYSRVSKEEQIEGHSLDAQKNVCREVAEKRKWIVVGYYEDPGFSAKDDKRPAFKKMIVDAEQEKFDVVLVHKLDRFSRSIEQTLSYFRHLNEYGVVFASATENFDFTRAEGRLFFNMMAVFAQWYLENLSAEAIKAKEELFRKGLHNGLAPFGYKKDRKSGKCVPIPEEAQVVKAAFELAASGSYNHRMIADMLNQKFVTRRGRHFSKDTVTNMLRNEFYYGMVSLRENIRPGVHTPIIDKELYDKAQEATHARAVTRKGNLLYRHTKKGPKSVTQEYYMLQRIIRCNACGRYLRIQVAERYRYYKEVSVERGLTCELASKTIRMGQADQNVIEILGRLRLPPDWQQEIEKRINNQDWVAQILRRKENLEEKIQRLDDVYLSTGKYTRAEYLEQRGKLAKELDSLVVPEKMQVIEKGLALESLGEYLREATSEELSQICRTMLDSVYTDFVNDQIVRIKPVSDFLELFRVAAKTSGWIENQEDGSFFVRAA